MGEGGGGKIIRMKVYWGYIGALQFLEAKKEPKSFSSTAVEGFSESRLAELPVGSGIVIFLHSWMRSYVWGFPHIHYSTACLPGFLLQCVSYMNPNCPPLFRVYGLGVITLGNKTLGQVSYRAFQWQPSSACLAKGEP